MIAEQASCIYADLRTLVKMDADWHGEPDALGHVMRAVISQLGSVNRVAVDSMEGADRLSISASTHRPVTIDIDGARVKHDVVIGAQTKDVALHIWPVMWLA